MSQAGHLPETFPEQGRCRIVARWSSPKTSTPAVISLTAKDDHVASWPCPARGPETRRDRSAAEMDRDGLAVPNGEETVRQVGIRRNGFRSTNRTL